MMETLYTCLEVMEQLLSLLADPSLADPTITNIDGDSAHSEAYETGNIHANEMVSVRLNFDINIDLFGRKIVVENLYWW